MSAKNQDRGYVVLGLMCAITVLVLIALVGLQPQIDAQHSQLKGPIDQRIAKIFPDHSHPEAGTFPSSSGPNSLPDLSAPTCTASRSSKFIPPLTAPSISPAPGTFATIAFPLQVTLTKHKDDPATSQIFYSVEPNHWELYQGPFSVDAGTECSAYAYTDDPAWGDSAVAVASYLSGAAEAE